MDATLREIRERLVHAQTTLLGDILTEQAEHPAQLKCLLDDLAYLLQRVQAAEKALVGTQEIIQTIEAEDMQDVPCSMMKQSNIIRFTKDALAAWREAQEGK